MLSLFSCVNKYEEDISNVEFLLGTDLNVNYEIENIETPFDFVDYYISFDLMFNKNDFDSLLKNADIDRFEKVDFEDVGVKNELRYYR